MSFIYNYLYNKNSENKLSQIFIIVDESIDIMEYDNINKIIFKGPKEYTSRFLSSLQNKVNTKFQMNDIKFELREQGEHI